MHLAARNGHIQCVKLLLEKGININIEGYRNGTQLHEAVQSGEEQMITFLIDKGCNINAVDNLGKTALDFAIVRKMNNIAKILNRKKLKPFH